MQVASSSDARTGREVPPALHELGLGPRLLTNPAALAAFGSDALTAFHQRPLAVVVVETEQEVIDTVRACHREGIPFVARGSGTSLSGGSVPVEGGIVIALNRLNRVLRLDPVTRTAVVQPGIVNLEVSRAAAPHGLAYAPDPSSQSVCSIGGNLAFNSGGAHCLKHGMTSNHVIGIKAVLPDGEVVELGGDSTEPIGPDWTGMFCGSEGLFGIALEATLRLVPLAEATRTALAVYGSLQDAGEAVAQIVGAGMLPVAMEIMDALAIEAAEASVKPGYPKGAALLIVELEGEREEVEADAARLDDLLRASGATEVSVTEDVAERALIWKGRKSAVSAVGWLAPDYIVQDGVVPRTRLGEALAEIDRMSKAAGIRVANVFHAGDGNLHPLILFDGREEGAVVKAEELAADILRLCVALGGSITGEHGVAIEKRAFLPLMFSDDDLELMRRVRHAVDPDALANRGKMLEPAPAPPPAPAPA
jgi:glycolate oxidase